MGLFDAIKGIGKGIIGEIPGGSLAMGALEGLGAFAGAGERDRAAQQNFADQQGLRRAEHAQNWFNQPGYDWTQRGRSSGANLTRSLGMGGGLSSSLMGLLAPKFQAAAFDELMGKTDPSQFFQAPEKQGFMSKLGTGLAAGLGGAYADAANQNRFNQQMDAMKGAYGYDRGSAEGAGRLGAARDILSRAPTPQLPGGGLSTSIAPGAAPPGKTVAQLPPARRVDIHDA